MATGNRLKISRKNITYIVVCVSALLAFALLAMVPAQQSITNLDRDIAAAKTRLSTQETLYPIYTDLKLRLSHEDTTALPYPSEKTIDAASIPKFITEFKNMAKGSHMEVISITPDFAPDVKESNLLRFSVQLQGKFIDFRQLLEKTGGVAALRRIEGIQINSAPGHNEFQLRLWLALSA